MKPFISDPERSPSSVEIAAVSVIVCACECVSRFGPACAWLLCIQGVYEP